MKRSNNQRGFGAIVIFVIVLVIAAAGGGYYVWHKNQRKPATATVKAKQVSVSVAAPAKKSTTDQYAGWQEYCSPTEKACFKYPSDWQTTVISADDPNGGEGITLTSPNGTVLRFQATVTGIGGGCDETTDPHIFITKVTASANVIGLYSIETSTNNVVNHIGLSDNNGKSAPAVGDVGDCIYYTVFKAHHDSSVDAWFETTTTQKFNATDLPTLELILASYRYQ